MNTLQGILQKRRADGWWYPWIFVGAMGIVVLVNGVMVSIALNTWTGLETAGHYEKGLAYNQNLAAAKAQAARGWQLDFAATPLDSGSPAHEADLRARFADRDGQPLDGLEVTAFLIRPTHEGFDREVRFHPTGSGIYEARAILPLAGQWAVRIHAVLGDVMFQDVRRMRLP